MTLPGGVILRLFSVSGKVALYLEDSADQAEGDTVGACECPIMGGPCSISRPARPMTPRPGHAAAAGRYGHVRRDAMER